MVFGLNLVPVKDMVIHFLGCSIRSTSRQYKSILINTSMWSLKLEQIIDRSSTKAVTLCSAELVVFGIFDGKNCFG